MPTYLVGHRQGYISTWSGQVHRTQRPIYVHLHFHHLHLLPSHLSIYFSSLSRSHQRNIPTNETSQVMGYRPSLSRSFPFSYPLVPGISHSTTEDSFIQPRRQI